MPNDPMSDADKAHLAATKKLAAKIAAMALTNAMQQTTATRNEIVEDSFMSWERIQAIAEGKAEDVSLDELVRIGLALNMVPDFDFEPLS